MPLIHQLSHRRRVMTKKSWSNTVDTDTVNTEPQRYKAPAMCSADKKK